MVGCMSPRFVCGLDVYGFIQAVYEAGGIDHCLVQTPYVLIEDYCIYGAAASITIRKPPYGLRADPCVHLSMDAITKKEDWTGRDPCPTDAVWLASILVHEFAHAMDFVHGGYSYEKMKNSPRDWPHGPRFQRALLRLTTFLVGTGPIVQMKKNRRRNQPTIGDVQHAVYVAISEWSGLDDYRENKKGTT